MLIGELICPPALPWLHLMPPLMLPFNASFNATFNASFNAKFNASFNATFNACTHRHRVASFTHWWHGDTDSSLAEHRLRAGGTNIPPNPTSILITHLAILILIYCAIVTLPSRSMWYASIFRNSALKIYVVRIYLS